MGDVTDKALSPPVAISSTHDVTVFDCGKLPLTDWLRYQALKNEGRGSRTYVVCATSRVVAYYALAAGAVERDRAPPNLARNMPKSIPVIVLARLAVDKAYQRRRIGGAILRDALKRALNASREVGARAVLVHAIDDEAVGFYRQYGFRPFPTDGCTLFMPMSHITAAL